MTIKPETSDELIIAQYKKYREKLQFAEKGDETWERFRALEEEMTKRKLW